MKKRIGSLLICSLGVVAMASPLAAQAATKHHHRHAARSADASASAGATGQSGPSGAGNGETALTGATLTSASNAALADQCGLEIGPVGFHAATEPNVARTPGRADPPPTPARERRRTTRSWSPRCSGR